MRKLCFSCFKRIPLFAGKCPYCLDQHQGVYGRIIFGLLLIVGFFMVIHLYTEPPDVQLNDDQTIEDMLKGFEE